MLALLDSLLRRAAPVVKAHHLHRGTAQVRHYDAEVGQQLAQVPLDLGHHPAGTIPALGLVVEAVEVPPDRLRRPTDGTVQQVADAPLQNLVGRQTDRIEEAFGLRYR